MDMSRLSSKPMEFPFPVETVNKSGGRLDYETARNAPMIRANDAEGLNKIKIKLSAYMERRQVMKAVNLYYHQFKTLDGCDLITEEEKAQIIEQMEKDPKKYPRPYNKRAMDNIMGSIRSFQERIENIERWQKNPPQGWRFKDGEVTMNTETSRINVIFDTKPDIETLYTIKAKGYQFAPEIGERGAWQKPITETNLELTKQLFVKINEI